jgi:hypothetical protein
MKKRSLNEYRQSKEFGYMNPKKEEINRVGWLKDIFRAYMKLYPNDAELGSVLRQIFK